MDNDQVHEGRGPARWNGDCGLGAGVQRLVDWVTCQRQRWIILIDGRSGAGKTTFAMDVWRALAGKATVEKSLINRHPRLIHLDDFYPGWGGLQQARAMVADCVLHPEKPGYHRWDWANDVAGSWVDLDPEQPLIIEGVGALNAKVLAVLAEQKLAFCSVVVHAPSSIRELRALSRDPGFAPWWQMWAEQEKAHLETRPAAGFQVDSTKP